MKDWIFKLAIVIVFVATAGAAVAYVSTKDGPGNTGVEPESAYFYRIEAEPQGNIVP